MTTLERSSAHYETRQDHEDPRDSRAPLLRIRPGVAAELRAIATRDGYTSHAGEVQAHIIGARYLDYPNVADEDKDTGGYAVVESPEGQYYVSLFPESLGEPLSDDEADRQGLPALTPEVAFTQDAQPEVRSPREDNVPFQHTAEGQAAEASAALQEAQALATPTMQEEGNKSPTEGVGATDRYSILPDVGRDQETMDDEAKREMEGINNRIIDQLDAFTATMPGDIQSLSSQEITLRGTVGGMKEVLSHLESGNGTPEWAFSQLEKDPVSLLNQYNAQATTVDNIRASLKTIKNSLEADIIPDARAFLRRQSDLGFNIDTGALSYLGERIDRAEKLIQESWAHVNALESDISDRQSKVTYGLTNFVHDLRDHQWGGETIVVQLRAMLEELDSPSYSLGALSALQTEVEEVKKIKK